MYPSNDLKIVGPQAGAVLNVLGADIAVKSCGDPGKFFFADHAVPPGYAVPLHVHEDEDEAFYLLEGEVTLLTGDGEKKAGPGDYVHLPRGVPHGFVNASGAPARMLVVASPGGKLEGLFRGLDAAASQAAASKAALAPEQVGGICAAHGVRMLPPA
jgi:mannose-6-phosphate isomerase-like protein (cupin superfamily)